VRIGLVGVRRDRRRVGIDRGRGDTRIQRSGVSTGKSVPNNTFSLSRVLAYCTRIGGKYFGDQPDRSM